MKLKRVKLINLKDSSDPMGELHDIVNLRNKVIGRATRKKFLQNRKLMRRSAHIWLKNSQGKFWLQQRSRTKDIQPLHWQSACSGFVRSGARTKKQILADALRELKEELGIQVPLKLIKIIPMPGLSIGGIMVYWYIGKHDGQVKPNRQEIKNFKAFDLRKVWQLYNEKKMRLTEPFIEELKYFLMHSKEFKF
ncbi:MAG: NUDIX domain-containing protein [Candidatus Doudnabacteria bacterium]|nr:NUDIX domain-containing protein [Candidatus Doudnabacteria bacterium]